MSENRSGWVRRRVARWARWILSPPSEDRLHSDALTEVGRHSYPRQPYVLAYGDDARLRIGAFCSIANGVQFMLDGEHRTNWVTTFEIRRYLGLDEAGHEPASTTHGDIVVGNDVWICADAWSFRA